MKPILFICLICLSFSCDKYFNGDQFQGIDNTSDSDMYFYINYTKQGDEYFPAYGDLTTKPILLLFPKHYCNFIYFPYAPTMKFGVPLDIYGFSPDTLDRYSWEEIVAKEKYWFVRVGRKEEPVVFPDEFNYKGDQ